MAETILIIDDDETVRDAFELALEETPYDVLLADSGERGIEMLSTTQPDMIFLDLKMPGIDGVETLRRVRQLGCESPVYIVTAFLPEYLNRLAVAAKEGLVFGLGQKPLTGDQIRLIATSNLDGPKAEVI